ncbi:MAG: ComF family protein [Desulfobacteraceae bacterium]|nr:ComF family protein [Desulfobacteraceae bacterium]
MKRLAGRYHRVWDRIARCFCDAVYPLKCLNCDLLFKRPPVTRTPDRSGQIVHDPKAPYTETMPAQLSSWICPRCLNAIQPIVSPKCSCCGLPFAGRQGEDHLCGNCHETPPVYGRACASGVYAGALRAAIHVYKYHGNFCLSKPLGRLLFWTYTHQYTHRHIDCIVPVPLHRKRLRTRGFNQSDLLVAEWPGLFSGVGDGLAEIPIYNDLIVRHRHTMPQQGLNRKERQRNIRDAFRIHAARRIEKKHVLLVDDVYTTGATLNECARVLFGNGALDVDVITLARVAAP